MARRKQTFSVDEFKKRCNYFLHNSRDDRKEMRLAHASMLEHVLMDTGNYRGFGYLNIYNMEKSEEGSTVGINQTTATDKDEAYKERFAGTDDSRRVYF